jgi:hypothetical protein
MSNVTIHNTYVQIYIKMKKKHTNKKFSQLKINLIATLIP